MRNKLLASLLFAFCSCICARADGVSASYANWTNYPAVFTWTGGSSLASGTFALFDLTNGVDTSTVFQGGKTAAGVPGWSDGVFRDFASVFSDHVSGGVPLSRDSGYVLRLANNGADAAIEIGASTPVLGGLLVEDGATGYSLVGEVDLSQALRFGSSSVASTNLVEIGENLTISRSSSVEFSGHSSLIVKAGRTLQVDGKQLETPVGVRKTLPYLALGGDGSLQCNGLAASGAATLDFSALPRNPGDTPFVQGVLDVSLSSRLVLPASLAAGVAYPLGSSNKLLIDGGTRAVAFGEGEFQLVNLSADKTAGTVQWSAATVDALTLSSETVTWSSLTSSMTAGRPLVLTLTRDVRLVMDVAGVTVSTLLVLGDHRLSIVMKNTATIGSIFTGRNAGCEYVYYYHTASDKSEDFGADLMVLNSVVYDTAIEGPTSGTVDWPGEINASGSLILRNHLTFTNGMLTANGAATIRLDSGAEVVLGGKTELLSGRTEVAEGAKLRFDSDGLFIQSGTPFEMAVMGILDFGATKQTLAKKGTLELHGGCSVIMDSDHDANPALTFTTNDSVHVLAGATANQAVFGISYATAVDKPFLIEEDSELKMMSSMKFEQKVIDPTGPGSIQLVADVLMAFTNDLFCSGGLNGAGTALFTADPSASMVSASLANETDWSGECQMHHAQLKAFDPAGAGNVNSVISFKQCQGYFAQDAVFDARVLLYGEVDDEVPSLKIDNGFENSIVNIQHLEGIGRLVVATGEVANVRHRVLISECDDYWGAIETQSNALGAILFVDPSAGTSATVDTADDGQIAVRSGEWVLPLGGWWKSAAGIRVDADALVVDQGEFKSPVLGSGTVEYSGSVSSAYPESVAGFDQTTWRGTVTFRNGTFTNRSLLQAGNADSLIVLSQIYGSLAPQDCPSTVELNGPGLTVSSASGTAEFAVLKGSGNFYIETGSESSGSILRFHEVEDFTGKLNMQSDYTTLVFGEDTLEEHAGTLVFSDGVRIRTNAGWTVPHVAFGNLLTTLGFVEGDVLVKATEDSVLYLENVRVTLEEVSGLDARQLYGLEFDQDSSEVKIAKAETPPDMDVGDVRVRYGVDFTNVTVRLSITNYWEGYKFNGKTIARVLIYDSWGHLVGARECLIDGDGDYQVGGAALPFGPGSDYRFDVNISTEQRDTGEITDRGGTNTTATAMRYAGVWFYENDQSLMTAAPSSLKTGTWTYGAGTVSTNADHAIVVNSQTQTVVFAPYRQASNDFVRVHYGDVTFNLLHDFGGAKGGYADIGGGFAAVTMSFDDSGEEDEPYFAVWVCGEDITTGEFVRVSGAVAPAVGVPYSIDYTINRNAKTIGYQVNDCALTNADGDAYFPLPDAAVGADFEVAFKGTGKFTDILGDRYNAMVAGVVSGGVTNEYATVDAAVAAATNAGDQVALLWDASWRPKTEDVGRTITINNGDYVLYVDAASTNEFTGSGYRFIDNQNGSYTIGVIEYELQFQPNDASGSMTPQKFSVTNMIFNLVSNAFVRTGSVFSHWNNKENGRGLYSWSDGGVIDMNEFGLVNTKIYAQWKVAVNTIIIEPADEYVYVESITTNGEDVTGVKYIGHSTLAERMKGRGSVQIRVEYGSTLVVRFSTDIGKVMTTPDWQIDPGYRQYSNISNDFSVANLGTNLPRYTNDVDKISAGVAPAPLDEVDSWAIIHAIPLEAAHASPYALASAKLGLCSLATEDTELLISDFKKSDDCYTFKVTVDGNPLDDPSKILPMIQVTGDLASGWHQVEASKVSVDEQGMVTVLTDDDSAFVKIVIK